MEQAIAGQRGKPGEFRRGLMLYGSTAALAAALMLAEGGIGPAMAQEIGPRIVPTVAAQGDFAVPGPTPTPSFEFRSGSLDIVHMNRDAVLNWTAYDTAPNGGVNGSSYVNFLPAGTELRFVGNGENFTAINRVFTIPDDAGVYRGIAFQGQVTSYLFGDGQDFVGPVAGNIWFFSPGGILATGSASFNVGSLLLSTSDLTNFSEFGNGRSIDFSGVADPFSSVILQTGARVTLTQPGSSFAIVAPTIEQGGDVFVDGSVLYLSGEQGNIYFANDGSIYGATYVEAQAGNQIRHLGTTTGPASIGTDDFSVFDPQTIEFRTGRDVGVLLSGSIGFAGATDASFGPNGSIVLSAGPVTTQGNLTLTGNTTIEGAQVELRADAGETIRMGQDANGAFALVVESDNGTLAATGGGLIDLAGDVSFDSLDQRASHFALADGGRIAIGGNFVLDASVGQFGTPVQIGGIAEATIANGGSIAVGGAMTLNANAHAIEDDGVTFAQGGTARLVMSGAGSSLIVGGALNLTAEAVPFSGLCECSPPNSGSAAGGYAGIIASEGTIAADRANASARARAFTNANGAALGHSLDAQGGTAEIRLGDSEASFGRIDLLADASAANGAAGEAGGAAMAGTARFEKGAGGSLEVNSLSLGSSATGGAGGSASESFSPGQGGAATGGTASIVIGQNPLNLNFVDLEANATGGQGGAGSSFGDLFGADGGAAQAGNAVLSLSGSETQLTSISEGTLSVAATGGRGGGGAQEFSAGQSGDGGIGGSATGGTLAVTAADGAEYRFEFAPDLAATGGAGGRGGDGYFNGEETSAPGLGGSGGDATGATIAIAADGGLISGDLELDVRGFGGEGGQHGFDFNGNPTGSAGFGNADGGSIALVARDNGASRFDIGFATLLASGNVSGTIEVLDQSTDAGASMHFESFAAYASGNEPILEPAFQLTAGNNAVRVDGTAEIYADSVALDFSGTGRLDVGGFTTLNSFAGDIAISHAGNPDEITIHSGGGFDAYASGNYLAGEGTVVRGAGYVSVRSQGSIDAADTGSLSSVYMEALGDATVGNVTAGGSFQLYAGRSDNDGSVGYFPGFRALVTGAVSADSVTVESGGFAEFASAAAVRSNNAISVRTGDDIVVASGASLVSDLNPGQDLTIRLLAGDINVGPFSGDLVEPITTPIASLIVRGSLDTNGHALYLSGDAIDATGSSIATGSLFADVTDAPVIPPYSNDAGLLTPGCFQGSACLGDFSATGDVAIGLASNNGLVSLRTGAIDFTGTNFDVVTLERLDLNTAGLASTVSATARISLQSVSSNIGLTNLQLSAPTLRLSAGGSVEAASSSLFSPNDIEIRVGDSLFAGSIATGGVILDGSESATTFHTPGDFQVDSLTYGDGRDMLVDAGGDLSLGFADAGPGNIELSADGSVFLGSTALDSGAIRLDGESVSFNNLRSSGLVHVTAGSGGITGHSEVSPVIDTTGGIALESLGGVDVGGLVAGTDIAISAAAVSALGLTAGGALAVDSAGAIDVVSFSSGGDTMIGGESLVLTTGTAGGALAATANSTLTFSALSAGGDATLRANTSLSGGNVSADGRLILDAMTMAIGTGAGSAGVSALAGSGASFTGLASSDGSVNVTAGAAVTGGSISAAADVGVGGGSLAIGGVTAGNDIALIVGSLSSGDFTAGRTFRAEITSGAAEFGRATAGFDAIVSARSLDAAQITAGRDIDVTVSQAIALDDFTSGRNAALRGSAIHLGTGTIGGNLSAQANAGGIAFVDIAVGADADLNASEGLGGGDITAGGALALGAQTLAVDDAAGVDGVTAIVSGNAGFGLLASAEGAVSLDAGGAVSGGSASAADSISIAGTSVALDNASFGNGLSLTARETDLTGSGLYQGSGPATLQAARGIAIGSVDTLGGIAMNAGTEARFVELRSRDGSVGVTAGGAITGSSVAADGSDLSGEDNVSLVAGGAISLDGAVNTLNPVSRAQDDFSASAGGAVAIVRAEAGRDLSLSAGSGSVNAAGAAAGRDLALSGPSVQLVAGEVVRNLTVRATGGDIAGSGVTTAGGVIDLGASGNIAVGSLSATGGALTATAGGSIGFTDLGASGALALSAGTGIAGTGDVSGAGGVSLTTIGGATSLQDIRSDGAVNLSGGASLTMRDVVQIPNGSLTVAYDGAIVMRNASLASGVDISGGSSVTFGEIRTPGSIALDAAGAVTGTVLDANNGISALGANMALGSVSVGEGDASLETSAGALSAESVSADNVRATAVGNLALGTTNAGHAAHLAGASLTLGSATAGSGMTLESAASGGIASGALTSGNTLSVEAGSQGFAGTSLTAGGGLELASGGAIGFSSASAGGSADFDAAGAVTGGSLVADGFASVDAGGAIVLTGLDAFNARLRSTGGPITASGIAVDGLLDARGTALTLAAPGALQIDAEATGGGIGITAGGDLRVNAIATGDIALASTGGSVIIGSVGETESTRGGIGAEAVDGGAAVAVTAANAISVADSLIAGGALSMTAGGLVSLDGAARGQTIALQAGDLAIGSGGSLGGASTQRISLASTAAVNLGSGASGGFAVDTAEFGRIQSGGDLMVTALAGSGNGAGSLTAGSLTVNAGTEGQVGTSGTFGLTASGVLDVNNTLSIARAGSGNTLILTGDAVDLDYANAALSVLDASNAATGRIIVNGRLITSISASAAADIAGKAPEEISLRLGLADVVREIALFRTGSLTLEGRDAILIQNSGGATIDERRGVTVGALTVTGAADGHTLVILNGIVADETGIDAAGNVTVTNALAAGSSVNGCQLSNIAGCLVIPEPEVPLITTPDAILFGTGDLIKGDDEESQVEDGAADGKPDAPPIDTTRIDDPAGLPMIDDPVTGAGNEDLWQPPEP